MNNVTLNNNLRTALKVGIRYGISSEGKDLSLEEAIELDENDPRILAVYQLY